MKNSPSNQAWLIPALVAAILFIGGVAGNLIATDLEPVLKPYRRWVWLAFVIALVTAVAMAIVDAHRKNSGPTADMSERSIRIGNNVANSILLTGDSNVVSNIDGDAVGRDKIVYHIQQTINLTVNVLHQLRPPVGDFVGREQEIEILINALRHDSKACISGINGMGGIGKTELALLVAARLSSDYPDAQLFINLQGTDANPRSPEQVMEICLRAFLGSEAKLPQDLDQLSQLYRNQLNGKRVLLLLDNAADSAQVRPLLPPAGSALLITSRHAIILAGMTPLTLNPLTNKQARELLLEIAPHAQPAAEQICRLCGYLPLAIRAAGSLLAITPDLNPGDYAVHLEDERNRLERIGAEGVEIDVAASFNLSYARLSPEAARVFRLLSVFPGTFDATAAEVIGDDAGHASLSDLVRRSLVLYDAGTKRYRLHDLARLFADKKLSDEERAIGLERHARYYKEVLAVSRRLYDRGGEELTRGLALLDLEWANIQAGHAWVATQGVADDESARLGMAYHDVGASVLTLRQHSRELIQWMEIALAAARRLKDRAGGGRALNNLGVAYHDLGQYRRAIEFYEQRLVIAREIGDRKGEGGTMANLGNAYLELGETQHAIEFYEQGLVIGREIGDRKLEGAVLGNLGSAYSHLGDTQRAIQFHEQRLAIAREMGDRRGEAAALGNLGSAYVKMGENKRAIQFYEQQLTIARELGDRRDEGIALGNLGLAYNHLRDARRAIEFCEQALVIARQIDDRQGESMALSNISVALNRLGQRAQAIEYAEQSLIIREQIEDPDAAKVRAQLAVWRTEN